MRIIKFRAWDKEHKRFEYLDDSPVSGDLFLNLHGVLCIITEWSGYDGGGAEFTDVSDKFELTEFTGLLDKNGNEIYEGDIINAYDHPTNMESVKGVSVVFVACSFRDSYNGYVLQDSYINIEVIGNIHENPELLK